MLLMAVTAAFGQEAKVKRVEPCPMDLSASKYQRFDLNGKACALVRVEVLANDVQFSGSVVGEVEHRTGEYWVYMEGGSKMLRISSGTFLPVMIDFREYLIEALMPNCTYVVTLSLPTAAENTPKSRATTMALSRPIITVIPATSCARDRGGRRVGFSTVRR